VREDDGGDLEVHSADAQARPRQTLKLGGRPLVEVQNTDPSVHTKVPVQFSVGINLLGDGARLGDEREPTSTLLLVRNGLC
jgi:hypothetical protein